MDKNDLSKNIKHYPVMLKEVIEYLNISNCKVVVDCTLGGAGHAKEFLNVMPKEAILIGLDSDQNSVNRALGYLDNFKERVKLVKENFVHIDNVLENLKVKDVDAFLFDLGISMYQLTDPNRGFSFLEEGPLDMRMNKDLEISAQNLVNELKEQELINIIRDYGQERFAKRIGREICRERRIKSINTTKELAELVLNCVPGYYRHGRLHPATRTFQALRIAVNKELEVLPKALENAINFLAKGARIAVISFHSLEDRIVKNIFRDFYHRGVLKIITKKPLTPSFKEISQNRASRSAKLRVAEKLER